MKSHIEIPVELLLAWKISLQYISRMAPPTIHYNVVCLINQIESLMRAEEAANREKEKGYVQLSFENCLTSSDASATMEEVRYQLIRGTK